MSGQNLVTQSSGEHDARGAPGVTVQTRDLEAGTFPSVDHQFDVDTGDNASTTRLKSRMQGMQQLERIGVTVKRAVACADNSRAYGWKTRFDFSSIEHFIGDAAYRFVDLVQHDLSRLHFSIAKAQVNATGLMEGHVDAG